MTKRVIKNNYAWVITLLCFIGCVSNQQNSDVVAQQTDLEKTTLKGKVKSVSELLIPVEEKYDGTIQTYENLFSFEDNSLYNEDGYLTLISHVYKGEEIPNPTLGQIIMTTNKETRRTLNEKNKLLEEIVTRVENPTLIKKITNEYYPDGITLHSSVTEEHLERNGNKSIDNKVVISYNQNGDKENETGYQYLHFSGEEQYLDYEFFFTYKYNDDKKITEEVICEKHYDHDFQNDTTQCYLTTLLTTQNQYNKYGNIVESNTTCDTTSFIPGNRFSKAVNHPKHFKSIYKLDDKGKNVIEKLEFINSECVSRQTSEYDQSGRLTKKKIYDENGEISMDQSYTYTSNGETLTIKEISIHGKNDIKNTYDTSGRLVKTENSGGSEEYKEFDNNSNWILAYVYDQFGKLHSIKKRLIKYHD